MQFLPSPSTTQTDQWFRAYKLLQSLTSGPRRGFFESRYKLILTTLGFSVGLANSWRLPYAAFKSGSGGFIFVYVFLSIVIGLPLLSIECLLGQFSQSDPTAAFTFLAISQGVGVTMFLLSFFLAVYIVIFLVYSVKYFFLCFEPELYWISCNETWTYDDQCVNLTDKMDKNLNYCPWSFENSSENCVQTPSRHFWERYMIHSAKDDIRYSLSNAGSVKWDLLIVLIFCWIAIFLCTIDGVKSASKFYYTSSIVALACVIILTIHAVCQVGAVDGLLLLITPTFEQLINPMVWKEAAIQVFLSFGIGVGGQLLIFSYKHFRDSFHWDFVIVLCVNYVVTIANAVTSYSILGNFAQLLNVDIKIVAENGPYTIGPDVAFVLFPEALARLSLANIWCLIYFIKIFFMVLGAEFVLVDVVSTILYEQFFELGRRPILVRLCVCFVGFVASIPYTTQGGIYMVEFMDTTLLGISLCWIGFFEIFFLACIYGFNRFCDDVLFMLGTRPSKRFIYFWVVFSSITLLILLGLSFNSYVDKSSNYPEEFYILGWIILVVLILQVPFWALCNGCLLVKTTRNFKDLFTQSKRTWGPRDVMLKILYLDWQKHRGQRMEESTAAALKELQSDTSLDLKKIISAKTDKPEVFEQFITLFHREEFE